VVDGRDVVVERGGAVDAAPAAITHHGVFDRTLLVAARRAPGALRASRGSRKTGKADVVIVSTWRQFHLAEKATPRSGSRSRSGASREALNRDVGGSSAQAALAAARLYRDVAVAVDS
jgi:hypothetical protein